ncbi:uncharacterized protein K444DRAFT_701715 [Hyaloscypha bicolor E]|uniref:Uncharacterized protein n=1 Tax=Hyaloscypha bicolor E TaxID=1095630 RepID=A0A2J6TSV6_9HELO|nr:uncharacterized protein K444DRAFT_701715 [Hyaloscypha bicolor E]PMD66109.1 hypothetical protein K444DRAFT_701715 [Hyaloscypha bicolor E]
MPQTGYLKSQNDDRLIVTTGSEAAAKYCLKTSMLHLEVKNVVLIVECGGQLSIVRPMSSPVQVLAHFLSLLSALETPAEFHRRIKDDFRHAGQNWVVDVDIEADFPWAGIEKGCMEYTNGDILLYFKPVVKRIVEMARNRIIAIHVWNGTLKVYH